MQGKGLMSKGDHLREYSSEELEALLRADIDSEDNDNDEMVFCILEELKRRREEGEGHSVRVVAPQKQELWLLLLFVACCFCLMYLFLPPWDTKALWRWSDNGQVRFSFFCHPPPRKQKNNLEISQKDSSSNSHEMTIHLYMRR